MPKILNEVIKLENLIDNGDWNDLSVKDFCIILQQLGYDRIIKKNKIKLDDPNGNCRKISSIEELDKSIKGIIINEKIRRIR